MVRLLLLLIVSVWGASSSVSTKDFFCGENRWILESWVCDGENDCPNGADEYDCPETSTIKTTHSTVLTSNMDGTKSEFGTWPTVGSGEMDHYVKEKFVAGSGDADNGKVSAAEHTLSKGVSACDETFCHNGGSCLFNESSRYCQCLPDYDGTHCEVGKSSVQSSYLWIILLGIALLIVLLAIVAAIFYRTKRKKTDAVIQFKRLRVNDSCELDERI